MSQNSPIEWTEATWNPVRGCVKVSPGCANCYAETFAERWRGVPGHAYEQGFDLRVVPEKLDEPLRRKKPTTYFVNSMSDLFQEGVPDAFIDRVFAVMALAPQHTFQVLTKRAERMRAYFKSFDGHAAITRAFNTCEWASSLVGWEKAVGPCIEQIPRGLPNVWLGVSVENQHFADERIPLLLQTPAAVRFISAEPLLGPVDLEAVPLPAPGANHYGLRGVAQPLTEKDAEPDDWKYWTRKEAKLDWVIVGGESGHGARPFDVAWARSIVSQCKAAGVPVFVKQLGARPRVEGPPGDSRTWVLDLASRKGGDPDEWPEDLRVREMPAK